jgi:Chaperone for flagella basal body P-ring formation
MAWRQRGAILMAMIAGPLALWAQPPERVPLREEVEVHGRVIRLADLLPTDAPRELRDDAAKVELGRAPQAGSERILAAAQIASCLAGEFLARQIAIPARVTVLRQAWPLRRDAVLGAVSAFLRLRGWRGDELPSPEELQWPQDLRALDVHPNLEVTGANWDPSGQGLSFRLRCADRTLCGSFLVQMQSARTLLSAPRHALLMAPRAASPPLARPGRTAMLILEGAGIRISLPVICLEQGGLRQQVRVRDLRGRRVFHAEVVGAGLLHATF